MISKMHFAGEDKKVRKYLLPKAVIYKAGDVSGEDNLLVQKDVQISTDEPDSMEMKNTGDGTHAVILLDFGVEFAGGIKILTERCDGGLVTPDFRLTFGESANEAMSNIGDKNATNDHSIRDMNIQLTLFSDMEFGQTGYRFARLELLSPNTSVRIKSVLGVFTYRDLEYKGSFCCSDDLLNRIYDVAAYTCHLNMQNNLWDGIKRDRLVWIGDMHPEMLTIRTVFGYDQCIEEGLDFAARQTPLPDFANHMITYSMWWLLITWDWYLHNGKTNFIMEHREYIEKLLEQFTELVLEDGQDLLGEYPMGYFLDWPTSDLKEARAGVRALFAMALKAGAGLCDLFDNQKLEEKCIRKAELLGKNIPDEYGIKASAAFMSLAGHLDPKQAADEVLLVNGAKDISTFLSYYQLSAIANAGKMKEALDILKEYYGGMLSVGATTFWEDFSVDWLKEGSRLDKISGEGEYDIHGDNGAYCYIGYRHSLCHGWSSGPTAFLAERVLGIQIAAPGCKKIRIRPDLGQLQWAKGTYPTPYGVISVSHVKQADGSIKTEYDVPGGVTVID